MRVGDGVELPKPNDAVSALQEQTIPQTVCWAFMPIRLHHVPFSNTASNSLITPPDSDRSISGRFWVLQQLGLGKDKESLLCWSSSGSLASAACCQICNICKCRVAAGGDTAQRSVSFTSRQMKFGWKWIIIRLNSSELAFCVSCHVCTSSRRNYQTSAFKGLSPSAPPPPFLFLALPSVAAVRRKLST